MHSYHNLLESNIYVKASPATIAIAFHPTSGTILSKIILMKL